MKMKLQRGSRRYYTAWFLFIFTCEVFIALFLNDKIIRPYGGDFLVVIMIYCSLMMIWRLSILNALIIVLLFSFTIEFLQLIDIVELLKYKPPEIVMIVLGSSFSWWDLLAYTAGLLIVLVTEVYLSSARIKTGK